jgi:hypothetical protein
MTITTQETRGQAWRSYVDELTDVLGTVEVVGRDLGDQFANERRILSDMTYDERDDAIIVRLKAPDSEVERIEHVTEEPSAFSSRRASPRRLRSRSTSRMGSSISGSSISSARPRCLLDRRPVRRLRHRSQRRLTGPEDGALPGPTNGLSGG